jgi:phage terminase large subunit
MRAIIVRKTMVSLSTTALATWRKFVATELQAAGDVKFYGGSKEEPAQYRFGNGSSVMACGMDKPTRIMSSEYDLIYAQEAIELSVTDWENLGTRLRNGVMPYQQLIADTNPDVPTHWLKQRCDIGACRMLHSVHTDNPVLYDDAGRLTERGTAYMDRLDALTGVRLQRLRHGRWVAAEGMIYQDEWSDEYLIPPKAVPASWPRVWSVDFGFVHPFVWQSWAIGPDGQMVLHREIYRTRRTVDQHGAEILRLTEGDPRPMAVVCDHDAENRAQLERAIGMSTLPANKRVSEGIQAVQKRMREGRLTIMRNAVKDVDVEQREAGKPTCTADEIPGYVWDTGGGKSAREAPLKVEDDGCDAMRYAVVWNDLRSRPRVRQL